MTHYLDIAFLVCLVIKAAGSTPAWNILRKLPQPVPITAWQAFQVKYGLRKHMFGAHPKQQAVAVAAWGLWQFYLRESVFVLVQAPWGSAIALARSWNERLPKEPPSSTYLLHSTVAAACGCTNF